MRINYIASITLIILSVLVSCEKQNPDNIDVDTFVEQLVFGQYDSNELPAFSESDIPALLTYRNETTVITNFPRNWLSSYSQPECRLGMYVLWAIESVRAIEIDSEYLVGRFPSLNPVLALKEASPLELVNDDQSHIDAANAYNDWWNASYLFSDKMEIDPLEDTEYRWH
jgi:hypothetical protein